MANQLAVNDPIQRTSATIRRASVMEQDFFGGDHGFIVERDGFVVGMVAYRAMPDQFYVHSLFSDGSRGVTPMLVKRVGREAKFHGFKEVTWTILPGNESLLKWVKKGRARIECIVMKASV